MPSEAAALLTALFLAHFLLDFPLQPGTWIDQRYRRHAAAPTLYLHTLAHGAAAALCFLLFGAGLASAGLLGGVVFLTHFATDVLKSYLPRGSLLAFLGDQLVHWLVLLAVWAHYSGIELLRPLLQPLFAPETLLVLLAYVVILLPTSIVVALCLKPWVNEIRQLETEQDSLEKAGSMIGYLERLLILTFVLVGEYTAIGFVLALKTAFRFKDTDDRRKAEYIMMGTFLSFSITIALGLLVRFLLQQL